jgi:prepilin-type N-terminal cleavage/methylation domain-containing protein
MTARNTHGPGETFASGRKSAPKRGMTLVEVIVCMAIVGFLLAAAANNLIESGQLGLKTAQTLEHSRSSRELFDRLSMDIREAQVMVLHVSFSDRTSPRRDGQLGNYVVLHSVDEVGVVTRTVGYYTMASPDGDGWMLYRHDSENGDSAAGSLPATSTSGTHRVVTRAVQLPNSNNLFSCVRDRGISMQGEFGAVDRAARGRPEFIRCTITTRS